MIQVFGDSLPGNCYKIQLLLNHLAIDHNWYPVDILNGDTHTARFLELNANGKIPVVVLEDGRLLAESNAILNYFSEGTDYLPNDRYQRAKVLEWQFFEQYSHEPYIAVARFIARYQGMPESRQEEFQSKHVGFTGFFKRAQKLHIIAREKTEGGLSEVEERCIREVGLAAGARDADVSTS